MYFLWERRDRSNTDSMLMEIVPCQLYISISIILYGVSEVLQVIHSPLCNPLLPWHTSFTIILITKSAHAILMEIHRTFTGILLQRQQLHLFPETQLPADRLPCLCVDFVPHYNYSTCWMRGLCVAVSEEDHTIVLLMILICYRDVSTGFNVVTLTWQAECVHGADVLLMHF